MENPQMLHQIRNGSVKECEVYCEDGRRSGPWVEDATTHRRIDASDLS